MQDIPTQNQYDVLGVESDASPDEVRSAYRLRSHMFHPDKYENYPEPLRSQLKNEAAKEFKKLTTAYDVLRDPRKRAQHDRELRTVRPAPPRPARAVRAARTDVPARARQATVRAAEEVDAEEAEKPKRRRAPRAAAAPPPQPRERDPLLVVRPDRLDFGTVAAGATKQLPIKISNAGGRTLFGEISSNRAWLSVNRRSFISSSSLLFVTVDTSGLQPGEEYSGSLVVSTLNGGDQSVPVLVHVSGKPEPILAGAPSLLDFGVAEAGTSKVRTIKLTNAGTGTLIGSVAVRGSWLAVSESRFRGNEVSFEVIATTTGLPVGEQQAELVLFSNGGQARVQVLVEVAAPARGGAIVTPAPEARTRPPAAYAAHTEGAGSAAPDATAANGAGGLPKEQQQALLRRIALIEPNTTWDRDFLSRIVHLIRAGEPLAPGELAKIYELEAHAQARAAESETK